MHQAQTQTQTVWEFGFGLTSLGLSLGLGQQFKLTKSLEFGYGSFLSSLFFIFKISLYI